MDANGLRFWMLSQENDWLPPWSAGTAYLAGQGVVDANGNVQVVQSKPGATGNAGGISDATEPVWNATPQGTTVDGSLVWLNRGPDASDTSQSNLFYCDQTKRLQLRSKRGAQGIPKEQFADATGLVETVQIAQDQFGNYARWDASKGVVYAGGSGNDEVVIYVPERPNITDLVLGNDGILYIAAGGSLILVDRRNRWPDQTLNVAGFHFWRLVALPAGGVLALDRQTPQLGRVSGQPLQTGPVDRPNPGVMRPCKENPNPPRLVAKFALPNEYFVAIAPIYSLDSGGTAAVPNASVTPTQFGLLSWASNAATNTAAHLWLVNMAGGLITSASPALTLQEANFPYALAWLSGLKFAVLVTELNEALIYDLSDLDLSPAATALVLPPAGDTYILAANNLGPFAHGFQMPPMYANSEQNVQAGQSLLLPLLPLSLNSLAPSGATNPAAPAIIDSGIAQCIWHRLFLEGIFPAHCGAVLFLTASDNLSDICDATTVWYPITFGAIGPQTTDASLWAEAPTGIWQSEATEIPLGPTLLGESNPPIQPTQGLYMALVQRTNTAVRNLVGRYLGVRIQLNGNGRITPEIAGMRIYASRFSYVRNYLPAIYHENRFGTEADTVEESTRRDFLERFVGLFEAQLTRIEDRVANSYLLTRSESTPDSALPWLGGWIGIDPTNYPPDRSRARIDATPYLYRWRGTVRGITRALDVATNGLCSSGAIIVIEDYRLRHIFATILGADLAISANPLLPGYSGSSNSIVGDTLFLGDPNIQAELQALYATDLQIAGSAQAVTQFYDQLANRMTVFVHNRVQNVNLNLVARIVEAEKPAHILASVKVAQAPLMIGLASLVGVNTYLEPGPTPGTVTLDVSDIGRYDLVSHLPSLDPRMENGQEIGQQAHSDTAPTAVIKAPAVVAPGATILLDGSASTASDDLEIVNYRWTLIPTP